MKLNIYTKLFGIMIILWPTTQNNTIRSQNSTVNFLKLKIYPTNFFLIGISGLCTTHFVLGNYCHSCFLTSPIPENDKPREMEIVFSVNNLLSLCKLNDIDLYLASWCKLKPCAFQIYQGKNPHNFILDIILLYLSDFFWGHVQHCASQCQPVKTK